LKIKEQDEKIDKLLKECDELKRKVADLEKRINDHYDDVLDAPKSAGERLAG
jgi:peptidoglycan hydrolase CwlO-like protein